MEAVRRAGRPPKLRRDLHACAEVGRYAAKLQKRAALEQAALERAARVQRFGAEVETAYAHLRHVAVCVMRDQADGEDAVQEALLAALVKELEGDSVRNLPAWVRVVARNYRAARWRFGKRRVEFAEE